MESLPLLTRKSRQDHMQWWHKTCAIKCAISENAALFSLCNMSLHVCSTVKWNECCRDDDRITELCWPGLTQQLTPPGWDPTNNKTLAGTRHSANLDGVSGGGGRGECDPPIRVYKVCVAELSGNYWWIALDEYLRLVVRFFTLDQNVIQLWEVKGKIFPKSAIFKVTSPYLKNY